MAKKCRIHPDTIFLAKVSAAVILFSILADVCDSQIGKPKQVNKQQMAIDSLTSLPAKHFAEKQK